MLHCVVREAREAEAYHENHLQIDAETLFRLAILLSGLARVRAHVLEHLELELSVLGGLLEVRNFGHSDVFRNGKIALHVRFERDEDILVLGDRLRNGNHGGAPLIRYFPTPRIRCLPYQYILMNCFVIF